MSPRRWTGPASRPAPAATAPPWPTTASASTRPPAAGSASTSTTPPPRSTGPSPPSPPSPPATTGTRPPGTGALPSRPGTARPARRPRWHRPDRPGRRGNVVPELGKPGRRSGQAVHPMDVAARHSQRGVVLADGLFVGAVKQAVHRASGVVVQLDLAHAELIGPGVTRVLGDLGDGLGGQFQVLVKVHESGHDMLLRSV